MSQRIAAAQRDGTEAVRSSPIRGVPPYRLTAEQFRLVGDILWHDAEDHGFRGDAWTCGRVAGVLVADFRNSYSKSQMSRIRKHLGWARQILIARAIQRDEVNIERWRMDVCPVLKMDRPPGDQTRVCVVEAEFHLLPSEVKTYALKGRPRFRINGRAGTISRSCEALVLAGKANVPQWRGIASHFSPSSALRRTRQRGDIVEALLGRVGLER